MGGIPAARRGAGAAAAVAQRTAGARLLAFFRTDMGFGGNNGLTAFRDVLGFEIQPSATRRGLYIVSVLALGLGFLLCRWIVTSKLGRLLLALRDAENRVRFLGYRVENAKLLVFTFSAGLAGSASVRYVPQGGISHSSGFTPADS